MRNSSSSTSSDWPGRAWSAPISVTSTASCSAASPRSRIRDQRELTRSRTTCNVAASSRDPRTAWTRSALRAASIAGSVSARRKPTCSSSRVTTANSSSLTVAATSADAVSNSCVTRAEACASASRLAPCIKVAAAIVEVTSLRPDRDLAVGAALVARLSRIALARLQLGEEALDDATLPRLIRQRLADDPAGQLDRERADLGPQRGDRAGPLGLDLRLRGPGDAVSFGLRLGPQISDDALALLVGFLALARGVRAGGRDLLAVLRLSGLQLGPSFFGLLELLVESPLGGRRVARSPRARSTSRRRRGSPRR